MEVKEKIKRIYEKSGIIVNDDYIENAMRNKERVKQFMKLYKKEELESMNYILGKEDNNKVFTKFELEAMSKVNLFDRKLVNICKIIWDNRDNTKKLDELLKVLNESSVNKLENKQI